MAANAPLRGRKSDRLITPGASSAEIACDHACAPFDRAAQDMDRKWGIDRLPGLVPPAMAEKFGKAVAHLNDCIDRNDSAEVAAAAGNCIKGLAAMDAAAIAAGHAPMTADTWQIEIDGKALTIVRDERQWRTAEALHPGAAVVTLRELAVAYLGLLSPAVQTAKAVFPGARVSAVRSPIGQDLDDEIPY